MPKRIYRIHPFYNRLVSLKVHLPKYYLCIPKHADTHLSFTDSYASLRSHHSWSSSLSYSLESS
ncbi:hypothetical protein ACTXT7_017166, partial [Hymenolepis weldensis]